MTRFNTQLVHGLPVDDNNTGAVNPPIYNSSTYAFESVDAMPRWDYARSGNPTREFLEKQIAQLEHARSVLDWPPSMRCFRFSNQTTASSPATTYTAVRTHS